MGFLSFILPAIIGLLGMGKGGGTTPAASPDALADPELQKMMRQLLQGQLGDYERGAPLRKSISDTASWLMPNLPRGGVGGTPTPVPTPTPAPTPTTPPENTGGGAPSPPPYEPSDKEPPANREASMARAASSMAPPTSVNPQTMQHLARYLSQQGIRG